MTAETQNIVAPVVAPVEAPKPEFQSPGSQFPPTRPSKVAWAVGAILFVLFCAFVLSQSANMPIPQ